MKTMKKALSAFLGLILLMALLPMSAVTTFAETAEDTLVVGYSSFSGKFSPVFAETSYDEDVASMTTINLISSDRQGALVFRGKTGETRSYNGTNYTYYGPADVTITENNDGTVFYDFDLRNDIKFSDGKPLTVDDVIFSMYVLADPSFDGPEYFYTLPIRGMDNYRAGFANRIDLIAQAGRNNTDFTYWTQEQQRAYWEMVDTAPLALAEEIVNYCWDMGFATRGDITEAAGAWGFVIPVGSTLEDFANTLVDEYGGDIVTMINVENAGSSIEDYLPDYASFAETIQIAESVANIEGIQKTGANSLRVIFTGMSTSSSYLLSVPILPLHYYGDTAKYDYSNNKFGFDKNDLSKIRSLSATPMGAGPYKFVNYDNGIVSFEANKYYYLGTPKTEYVQFKSMGEADKLASIVSGTADLTEPGFSLDIDKAIRRTNSNGQLTGDKITTRTINNLGYGYFGMSANAVNVGGIPGSAESKNLRKALATVIARFREEAVNDYYGASAAVINYPISDTSWAAPQKGDPGYEVAFSKDVNNNPIYRDGMSEEDKTAAALKAALGFFEAAGYTVSNGIVTAAPKGARMEYEAWIPGGGIGDHPAFMMMENAANALSSIGITLTIYDPISSQDMWDGLDNGEISMWAAAWGSVTDPDMYQVYYGDTSNGGRDAGGSNYMYDIADAKLDELILEARAITDQSKRKELYRQCLDIVMDWAVEMPFYQRQNSLVLSTERLDLSTVTADVTPFYGWMSEIQNIRKTTGQQIEPEPEPIFSDVQDPSAWFYGYVSDIVAVRNKNNTALMSGYKDGSGRFGPADPLTRQDFAVILYRLADEPSVKTSNKSAFPDADKGGYYYESIVWAKNNKVITGYNDGRFGVGDNITREQVATILYRYAKDQMKIDVTQPKGDLSKFSDAKAVSSFAADALTWANGAGIITGKNGGKTIDPQGNAARAEIAAMILRFIAFTQP